MKVTRRLRSLVVLASMFASVDVGAQGADPLKTFQARVALCQAAYDAQPKDQVGPNPSGARWVHVSRGAARITYDVKRTDSLVSPYMAVLSIEQATAIVSADNETAATAADPAVGMQSVDKHALTFAFQNERWVATACTWSSRSKLSPERDWVHVGTFKLSIEKMANEVSALAKCALANP